jgi:hypothetical protein
MVALTSNWKRPHVVEISFLFKFLNQCFALHKGSSVDALLMLLTTPNPISPLPLENGIFQKTASPSPEPGTVQYSVHSIGEFHSPSISYLP